MGIRCYSFSNGKVCIFDNIEAHTTQSKLPNPFAQCTIVPYARKVSRQTHSWMSTIALFYREWYRNFIFQFQYFTVMGLNEIWRKLHCNRSSEHCYTLYISTESHTHCALTVNTIQDQVENEYSIITKRMQHCSI